jgi:hypothetical protein
LFGGTKVSVISIYEIDSVHDSNIGFRQVARVAENEEFFGTFYCSFLHDGTQNWLLFIKYWVQICGKNK